MPINVPPDEQSIERLQERYQALNTKKIQAETQRESAEKRLDDLKAQARDKYKTDDLAELQKMLDDMVAENARKRAEYQAALDKIEADLAAVEKDFAAKDAAAQAGQRP